MLMPRNRRSRFAGRLRLVLEALRRSAGRRHPPRDPGSVRRILVAHHTPMLGDMLMLTPLLAKLQVMYPKAETVLVTTPAVAPLYACRPYGISAYACDLRQPATLKPLIDGPGFDLAIVPGDNRSGWLARAAGARWIIGFAGDKPVYKDWLLDRATPYPDTPGMWGDMSADLIEGSEPAPYNPADWPVPPAAPFELPPTPYVVIHVGASTPLKQWAPENWQNVAHRLEAQGYTVVLSGGRGEEALAQGVDPQGQYRSYVGRLDLPQMWHLLAGASLLLSPDTGVAHLGRVVGTPTVTLFGPGSVVLCGAGRFWREAPYEAVTVDPFSCRDRQTFYRREIAWVRRCGRSTRECPHPRCMDAISPEAVLAAARAVMASAMRQEN